MGRAELLRQSEAWKEAYRPRMYVTFIGSQPCSPDKYPVAPGEMPVTGESCSRTFGPYYMVEICSDDRGGLIMEVGTHAFSPHQKSPEAEDGFCLATWENGTWQVHDGLEEEEGGPVYRWIKVEQKEGSLREPDIEGRIKIG